MSVQDSTGCNKMTVLCDNQKVLDSQIDMFTAVLTKLTTQRNNQGNLKSFKEK